MSDEKFLEDFEQEYIRLEAEFQAKTAKKRKSLREQVLARIVAEEPRLPSEDKSNKVVICHFYNEEHLLPWWLEHHKAIFGHGIMIDYYSTDRSRELIKEICPSWEIRTTKNNGFIPRDIDQEVMDIEHGLDQGLWRICLNVPEFLYGNLGRLSDKENAQYILPNYVFVDVEDAAKQPVHLFHDQPLHEQRYWGYFAPDHEGSCDPVRYHRSIHNHPIVYPDYGRHYLFKDYEYSFNDLVIFYYAFADLSEPGLARRLQIKKNIPRDFQIGHHMFTKERIIEHVRNDHAKKAIDLSQEIKTIIDFNKRCTGQDW